MLINQMSSKASAVVDYDAKVTLTQMDRGFNNLGLASAGRPDGWWPQIYQLPNAFVQLKDTMLAEHRKKASNVYKSLIRENLIEDVGKTLLRKRRRASTPPVNARR